jgi:hypothetical protein
MMSTPDPTVATVVPIIAESWFRKRPSASFVGLSDMCPSVPALARNSAASRACGVLSAGLPSSAWIGAPFELANVFRNHWPYCSPFGRSTGTTLESNALIFAAAARTPSVVASVAGSTLAFSRMSRL